MGVFEIETPQGVFEIEAPDMDTAMRAISGGQEEAPKPPAQHNVPAFDPGVKGYNPETGMVENDGGAIDNAGAFSLAGVEGLPVVGPTLSKGVRAAAAGMIAPFSDKDFGEVYDEVGRRSARVQSDNPNFALAGNVTGQVAGSIPLALRFPKLFGMAGSLGSRIGMGAASNAALAGADTAARGGDVGDIAASTALGGTVGAAVPALGAVGKGLYRAGKERVGSVVRGLSNPTEEATRRIAKGIELDRSVPGGTMAPSDYLTARQNNQPIINADLGGENVRALARAAANTNPEARAILEKTANERFVSQGDRVTKLINRISGGRTDDILAQEGLKDAAAAVNRVAYDKANSTVAAQAMYPKAAQELMQSSAFRAAVKDTTTRGGDRAAAAGFKAVKNPFHEAADGTFKLRRKADGSLVMPTLQFWDQVKRNLDGAIGTAKRAGDNTLVADLTAIKNKLVSSLDDAVPEYKTARQGAARFFGAEDALEAGKKFAKSTRMIPEYRRGVMSMKGPERELFETGFASEMIDAAKASGDSRNTIKQLFGSTENREKMVMAFGKERAREIEAFVRVEHAMDKLRGALGNSTTARQLIESGALGVGTWYYTGDMTSGVLAAAGRIGLAKAGQKVDENIMRKMAEMLTSDDPQMIKRAVQLAAKSPQHMAAIDAIQQALTLAVRGAAVAAN